MCLHDSSLDGVVEAISGTGRGYGASLIAQHAMIPQQRSPIEEMAGDAMDEDCLKLTTYFGAADRADGRLLASALLDLYAAHAVTASIYCAAPRVSAVCTTSTPNASKFSRMTLRSCRSPLDRAS
jgi:hypothetical protein